MIGDFLKVYYMMHVIYYIIALSYNAKCKKKNIKNLKKKIAAKKNHQHDKDDVLISHFLFVILSVLVHLKIKKWI